jgi:hypothetical protein
MSSPDHFENPSTQAPVLQTDAKSRKARISFILGLSSFLVSILAGIPAIINGLLSLKEIRQSGGRLRGKQLALSGIALGLVGSLVSGWFLMYSVARVQRAAQRVGMG